MDQHLENLKKVVSKRPSFSNAGKEKLSFEEMKLPVLAKEETENDNNIGACRLQKSTWPPKTFYLPVTFAVLAASGSLHNRIPEQHGIFSPMFPLTPPTDEGRTAARFTYHQKPEQHFWCHDLDI